MEVIQMEVIQMEVIQMEVIQMEVIQMEVIQMEVIIVYQNPWNIGLLKDVSWYNMRHRQAF
jgi:hypothetical protein